MRKMRRAYQTWLTTPRGREIVLYGISTVACGAALGNFLPHTFLLNKYQDFVQMYRYGNPMPVPKSITSLMENVMNDLGISERERKFIKAFTVYGFDVFHAGSTSTTMGAIIGIPSNFAYKSSEDIDKSNVIVNLKQVSWNSDGGKKLQEALVLSENAQKFAIGREISSVRTPHTFLNCVYPAIAMAFVYAFSRGVNDKLGLLHKHISVRLVFYSLVGMFGVGTWAFFKDFTMVHYEIQADKEMCQLGEHYIKGGLEFYSKLLIRNKALRELMGDKGTKMYAVTGNEQYMLRQKHLPLTMRRQYMEERLKELRQTSTPTSVQDASIPAPA